MFQPPCPERHQSPSGIQYADYHRCLSENEAPAVCEIFRTRAIYLASGMMAESSLMLIISTKHRHPFRTTGRFAPNHGFFPCAQVSQNTALVPLSPPGHGNHIQFILSVSILRKPPLTVSDSGPLTAFVRLPDSAGLDGTGTGRDAEPNAHWPACRSGAGPPTSFCSLGMARSAFRTPAYFRFAPTERAFGRIDSVGSSNSDCGDNRSLYEANFFYKAQNADT